MSKYITTDGLEVGLQITKNYIDTEVGMKQPVLVSGENIKTINGESILVGGNITIPIPDWSANSNNEGYIKNRTHYTVLNSALQTFTISSSQLNTNIFEVYADVDFMMNGIVYNTLSVLNKDIPVNVQAGGVATVVQSGSQYYLQFTEVNGGSITFEACNRVSVQQLSEAYIPNTIARISDFKTINGSPILGEGDLALAEKSSFGEFTDVVYAQAIEGGNSLFALPDCATGYEDDILLSRGTVKTINGESILGEGDLTVGSSIYTGNGDNSNSGSITQEEYDAIYNADIIQVGMFRSSIKSIASVYVEVMGIFSSGVLFRARFNSNLTYTVISRGILKQIEQYSTSDVSELAPDLTAIILPEVTNLTITSFKDNGDAYQEYSVIFRSSSTNSTSVTLPSNVYGANGNIPEIEMGVEYELGVTSRLYNNERIYRAILVPFKLV